jgi:MYXO-CTERM domain-containing protein
MRQSTLSAHYAEGVNIMSKIKSLLASVVILSCAAPALAAGPFSAVYSFGDSLSDVGNVYLATGGLLPAAPYDAGQFSNGPVWNQVLAARLGLGPLTPSVIGGNGYAWGNATTGYAGTLNPTFPSFLQQVDLFSLDHGFVAPSNALYTLSIGSNDLRNIIATATTLPEVVANAQGAAAAIATGVATLASEGVTDLVWFGIPDLGRTPEALAQGPGVSYVASLLSYYFNLLVLQDLSPLIASGLTVYDLNTFALLDAAVANPAAFGFSNVDTACYGGDYFGGGSACATPDSFLFWDQIHPTAAGHALIADGAFRQVTGAPEPATWGLALIGFAVLGFWRRRELRAAA